MRRVDDWRACRAIDLIAWALRTLTPASRRREIADWASRFAADLAGRK